jgi:tetratricopeptide (TPR) repeat protein
VQLFPELRHFCNSQTWRPVYLDEVSAVFMRRTPETENIIQKFQLDCGVAPLPVSPVEDNSGAAFNQWANAAVLLQALGRNEEAFLATGRALAIFDGSANVHYSRAVLYEQAGDLPAAEQHYRRAAELEPSAVAPWATLASQYEKQGRWSEPVDAWNRAAKLSPRPWQLLLSMGFANLQARRPGDALEAFNRASRSVPAVVIERDPSYLGNLAHGRAMAWLQLGNLPRSSSRRRR